MAKCEVCGKETALPFKCRYCGGTFCSEHRLPENHSCKNLAKIKPPKQKEIPEHEETSPPMEIRYEVRSPQFSRRSSRPKHPFFHQASMIILLVIVAVFIVQLIAKVILNSGNTVGDYTTFLYYLCPSPATVLTRPWTLITSIFAHANFAHLLANGIVIFFFCPVLEARIGRKKFLCLFFGAGILAGIAQLLVIPSNVMILGASGAILGTLGALTILAPRLPVLLFFFIPMQLWMITLGFGVLSAILMFTAPGGSIAHMAHFAGLVVGLIYGYKLRREERRKYRHFFSEFLI